MSDLKIEVAPSFSVRICIAGNRADAARICREYCLEIGFCVTLEDAEYIYTGGQESGVVIGLINYPRFPATREEIEGKAIDLGIRLMEGMCQHSFSIVTPLNTFWYSRRPNA